MKKFIWNLFFVVIGISVVYSTLCYFGPKKLDVSISEKINAPDLMVYNQINNFQNWNNWSSWSKMDTSVKISYGEIVEGEGAVYIWQGKKKTGQINIEASTKASYIKTKFTSDNNSNINFCEYNIKSNGDDKCTVSIDFVSEKEIPFFMRGYRLVSGNHLALKNGLKYDFKLLSDVVEKQFKDNLYNGYKINEAELEEKYFVLNRSKVKKENVQQYFAQNLGPLFQSIQKNEIKMNGMPAGLYFTRNIKSKEYDMAASIPVKDELSFDQVESITIPTGKAIVIDYYGDYTDIEKAHKAMTNYMKDHNIYMNPPIIESYITDPGEEKNPDKWLTKVIYYYSN